MPQTLPLLDNTKYAGAWIEHGHPYNDAAYSLISDAPLLAVRIAQLDRAMSSMEDALSQTQKQIGQLSAPRALGLNSLVHVEAALSRIREARSQLVSDGLL